MPVTTPPSMPPPSRRRESTRQRLLDAAAEVFAEVGLDAASVEAICERAGFTRGAFYSNFETKDELMLALAARVAESKLEEVTARIRAVEESGERLAPQDLVLRVLDVPMDQRMGILLSGEIRNRAMRDARLAETYLAWQSGMVQRIARIVEDLGGRYALRPRVPAEEFARLLLQTWEDAAVHAVMANLDYDAMCALISQRTAMVAAALVDEA